MKKLVTTLGLFFIIASCFGQEKIKIGAYTYYKQKPFWGFLKDFRVDVKWNQYKTKNGKHSFGYRYLATRNDSTFIKGFCDVDFSKRMLKFKEIYYYDVKDELADSLIEYRQQKKNGEIDLLKIQRYKNGKVIYEYPLN